MLLACRKKIREVHTGDGTREINYLLRPMPVALKKKKKCAPMYPQKTTTTTTTTTTATIASSKPLPCSGYPRHHPLVQCIPDILLQLEN
jgi:hypothetical protein